MKSIEELLKNLARPEVLEFGLVTNRLPSVNIGGKFEPVDDEAPSSERVMQMLVAMGGSRYVEALSDKPVQWTTRLEGVGVIAVAAILRKDVVQARFTVAKRDSAAGRPAVQPPATSQSGSHSPAQGSGAPGRSVPAQAPVSVKTAPPIQPQVVKNIGSPAPASGRPQTSSNVQASAAPAGAATPAARRIPRGEWDDDDEPTLQTFSPPVSGVPGRFDTGPKPARRPEDVDKAPAERTAPEAPARPTSEAHRPPVAARSAMARRITTPTSVDVEVRGPRKNPSSDTHSITIDIDLDAPDEDLSATGEVPVVAPRPVTAQIAPVAPSMTASSPPAPATPVTSPAPPAPPAPATPVTSPAPPGPPAPATPVTSPAPPAPPSPAPVTSPAPPAPPAPATPVASPALSAPPSLAPVASAAPVVSGAPAASPSAAPVAVPAAPATIAASPRAPAPSLAPALEKDRPRIDPSSSLDAFLAMAVDARASDLHLVAGRPILLRIASELLPRTQPISAEHVERIAKDIVPARLRESLEREGSCVFAIEHPAHGRFRVNVSRHRTGYKLNLRVIAKETPTLATLGLPEVLASALRHRCGLILVTGPRAQGKSCTLAALIDHLNRETARHVMTVEEPIEHVHQRKKGLVSQRDGTLHSPSKTRTLQTALREDVDTLAIGEIRDAECARHALVASEGGRLVIGTMNAPRAAKTVDCFLGLFPSAEQRWARSSLASSLRLVVGQRLVPSIDQARLHVAVELLPWSVALYDLVREGRTAEIPDLQEQGKAAGILRLDEALADLVRAQKVTVENAKQLAESPDELEALVSRGAAATGPQTRKV